MKALIERAAEFALHYHEGQMDRDGYPHFMHVMRVALKGKTDEEIVVGFLHDVIEDAKYPSEALQAIEADFPKHVLEAVLLLTKAKGEEYSSYITGIIGSGNTLAMKVKLNDLDDNIARSMKHKGTAPYKYLVAISKLRLGMSKIEPVNNGWLDAEIGASMFTEASDSSYLDGPAPVASLKRCP